MQTDNTMQLPIICLTTKEGSIYAVGYSPSYPKHLAKNEIYQDLLNAEQSGSEHHAVNAIHEQPDGMMVEILTPLGLSEEELAEGARTVTMVKIPHHEVSSVKAGYIKGFPRSEDTSEEE